MRTLITGGAGFVGTNLAERLVREGDRVIVLDSLVRPGVDGNLAGLLDRHADVVDVLQADLRDAGAVRRAVDAADRVFHLAGQVAVTTSLDDPMDDATTNVMGTLNVLEALRDRPKPLLFTSTNKVYGGLPDVELVEGPTRYEPADPGLLARGIGEARPLSFCTPYGCSKGAADQYVVDYAHSYGLPSVVFRMSCIYGPHQCGNEDQGWVAHFAIQALNGDPITIYGDGKQVRDVLFAEDLVEAMLLASARAQDLSGRAFNIGGGARNCMSLLELLGMLEELTGQTPDVSFDDWRPGDQRYYVSDTSAFTAATGWRPRVSPRQGVRRLADWLVPAPSRAAAA